MPWALCVSSAMAALTPALMWTARLPRGLVLRTNFGNAALIQADGKIVVAGVGFNGTNNDFALVRYNVDGGLDCTQCVDTGNLVNVYNRAIGADRLWNAPGYLQGQGVTVAVVDSGLGNKADLQVYGGGARASSPRPAW